MGMVGDKQILSPGEDFEIGDVEDYRHEQDHKFNHQLLVMECIRRCNEAGSHELRSGWIDEKVDSYGNVKRVYVEDTRKKFISSIKQLKANMICDFDEDAKNNIEKIEKEIEEQRDKLLASQWEWWKDLTLLYKQQANSKGQDVIVDAFNQNLPWFQKWVEIEVEGNRAIFEELIEQTKRKDFYEAEIVEA